MSSPIGVYRALLRSVNKHITPANDNPLWCDFVTTQFRKHAKTHDPAAAHSLLDVAASYAELLEDIHAHKVWRVAPARAVGWAAAEHMRRRPI